MTKSRVHFISIGGSAMHNLAIALHQKGYNVTGSDDQIFEPSRSRLEQHGLLPQTMGWNAKVITDDISAVILGMHARKDNPELLKAQEQGLPIYSYPEYLYEQTKEKKRVVIAGSHGKTSTTSMILHVLKHLGMSFDYMVGAQIAGFDTMVSLSDDSPIAVFEGDEYLSSPIDKRPKMHLYKPHIAVITGVAWDHINVFPTYEIYLDQFHKFIGLIEDGGVIFYCQEDKNLCGIMETSTYHNVIKVPYSTPNYEIAKNHQTLLYKGEEKYPLQIFGEHNLQNLEAAYSVCSELGISTDAFFNAISTFEGANKRLEKVAENKYSVAFLDFAHSPSKLQATIKAVKKQYPKRELIACMELHTFSSLDKNFLQEYNDSMRYADRAFVYFDPDTLKHKKLPDISPEEVAQAFNFSEETQKVFTDSKQLWKELEKIFAPNKNLLVMTSGNFSGIDIKQKISLMMNND